MQLRCYDGIIVSTNSLKLFVFSRVTASIVGRINVLEFSSGLAFSDELTYKPFETPTQQFSSDYSTLHITHRALSASQTEKWFSHLIVTMSLEKLTPPTAAVIKFKWIFAQQLPIYILRMFVFNWSERKRLYDLIKMILKPFSTFACTQLRTTLFPPSG